MRGSEGAAGVNLGQLLNQLSDPRCPQGDVSSGFLSQEFKIMSPVLLRNIKANFIYVLFRWIVLLI